jgi:hypothetical protein
MVMTTGLARAQDNGRPNATFPEQYATVLVASDFQPPESPDSQFMGILYITAEFVDGMVVLHTTLWHSVNFAVSAVVRGPAGRGQTGMTLFSLVPPGATASAADAPLRTSVMLDETGVNLLRTGQMYAEVSSGGLPRGQIRGQIEPRNDLYVSFMNEGNVTGNEDNTTGIALVYVSSLGQDINDPNTFVALDFWLLTRDGNGFDFVGLNGVGGESTFLFGLGVPVSNEFSSLHLFGQSSIQRKNLIVAEPVFGPGSSSLYLHVQKEIGVNTFLGQFMRLPGPRPPVEGGFGSGPDGDVGAAAGCVPSAGLPWLAFGMALLLVTMGGPV